METYLEIAIIVAIGIIIFIFTRKLPHTRSNDTDLQEEDCNCCEVYNMIKSPTVEYRKPVGRPRKKHIDFNKELNKIK